MKSKIIYCFLLLHLSFNSYSQETKAGKPLRFGSINQAGILMGDTENGFQLQTLNGMRWGGWFAGIGVGLDNYYFRSIPLFLDVRKNLLQKSRTPFVYADGGYQFLWSSEKDKIAHRDFVLSSKGGGYFEAGLGYLLPLTKTVGLTLSAGYSYKQSSQTVNAFPWLSIAPPPKEAIQTYHFSLQRIAIKAGIAF